MTFHLTGGLASPPESRYNSPTIDVPLSYELPLSQISPPKLVDHNDISSVGSGTEGFKGADDPMNVVKSQKLSDSSDIPNEEDTVMINVESKKFSLDALDEDDAMIGVQSKKSSLDIVDEDDAMIGIQSKKLLLDMAEEDDDSVSMESKGPSSDIANEEEPVIGIHSKTLRSYDVEEGNGRINFGWKKSLSVGEEEGGVKSKKSLSKPSTDSYLNPSLYSSDSDSDPMVEVKSKTSSYRTITEMNKSSHSIEAGNVNSSNDVDILLSALFEPRRSSRNGPVKQKLTPGWFATQRLSNGKSKSARKKTMNRVQVSIPSIRWRKS